MLGMSMSYLYALAHRLKLVSHPASTIQRARKGPPRNMQHIVQANQIVGNGSLDSNGM